MKKLDADKRHWRQANGHLRVNQRYLHANATQHFESAQSHSMPTHAPRHSATEPSTQFPFQRPDIFLRLTPPPSIEPPNKYPKAANPLLAVAGSIVFPPPNRGTSPHHSHQSAHPIQSTSPETTDQIVSGQRSAHRYSATYGHAPPEAGPTNPHPQTLNASAPQRLPYPHPF